MSRKFSGADIAFIAGSLLLMVVSLLITSVFGRFYNPFI